MAVILVLLAAGRSTPPVRSLGLHDGVRSGHTKDARRQHFSLLTDSNSHICDASCWVFTDYFEHERTSTTYVLLLQLLLYAVVGASQYIS